MKFLSNELFLEKYTILLKKFLFLILFIISFIYCFSKKTILVLHSYDDQYIWTVKINEGIKRLDSKKGTNINVLYHYMDTKKATNEEMRKKAGYVARDIIDRLKPEVVIAVDDNAQEYVGKYYINNPEISIVYAGVNAKPELYGYDKAKNVTGVLERIPIEGIKEFLINTFEKKNKKNIRVMHLVDSSKVMHDDDTNMREYKNWAPLDLQKSSSCETYDQWKKAVKTADQYTDILLISNYRSVYKDHTKKTFVPFKEVIKWTLENSPVPVLGINGFVGREGAPIGIGASPFEQGEQAMTMALSIVQDRKIAKDLPVYTSEKFLVLQNLTYMDSYIKNNLQIKRVYDSFARALGLSFSKKK